jgi:hypothetical protein
MLRRPRRLREMTKAKTAQRGKPSYDELLEALRACASALDSLMGDSDLDGDDSPEFLACQKANKLLKRAGQ